MPSERRRGGAMVELALCLPVLFLITIATVETCHVLYFRQSLKIAAYECARIGIAPGATIEQLQDQCDVILANRNLKGYEMTVTPKDLSQIQFGENITVAIGLPIKENSLIGSWMYADKRLVESVTIMVEY